MRFAHDNSPLLSKLNQKNNRKAVISFNFNKENTSTNRDCDLRF